MPFTLPDLPYPSDALQPHIDAKTMEIHHGKHHAAYIAKANAALEGTKFADMDAVDVARNLGEVPADKRGAVRNNLGGHVNHSLFWTILAPAGNGGGGAPSGDLGDAITSAFGSFDGFKEKFAAAAATRFGSGWAWLCVHKGGKLEICSTPNQDNPLMPNSGCEGYPILGLDVWEHAYYLNYQNRRPDYISAFFNLIDWGKVAKAYGDHK